VIQRGGKVITFAAANKQNNKLQVEI